MLNCYSKSVFFIDGACEFSSTKGIMYFKSFEITEATKTPFSAINLEHFSYPFHEVKMNHFLPSVSSNGPLILSKKIFISQIM